MKKRLFFLLCTLAMICLLFACGQQETDWGEETPETLPSMNEVPLVTPHMEEIVDPDMVIADVSCVTGSTTIEIKENGSTKEITLYGVTMPIREYEDEAVEYLKGVLPGQVYVKYIDKASGTAYVWLSENMAQLSNCVNYGMIYNGYAVLSMDEIDLVDEQYINAMTWAKGMSSGLWAKESSLDELIYNEAADGSLSENSLSDNAMPNAENMSGGITDDQIDRSGSDDSGESNVDPAMTIGEGAGTNELP